MAKVRAHLNPVSRGQNPFASIPAGTSITETVIVVGVTLTNQARSSSYIYARRATNRALQTGIIQRGHAPPVDINRVTTTRPDSTIVSHFVTIVLDNILLYYINISGTIDLLMLLYMTRNLNPFTV